MTFFFKKLSYQLFVQINESKNISPLTLADYPSYSKVCYISGLNKIEVQKCNALAQFY